MWGAVNASTAAENLTFFIHHICSVKVKAGQLRRLIRVVSNVSYKTRIVPKQTIYPVHFGSLPFN